MAKGEMAKRWTDKDEVGEGSASDGMIGRRMRQGTRQGIGGKRTISLLAGGETDFLMSKTFPRTKLNLTGCARKVSNYTCVCGTYKRKSESILGEEKRCPRVDVVKLETCQKSVRYVRKGSNQDAKALLRVRGNR
jgi:hypothetical protein